jgi:hypothetical protein
MAYPDALLVLCFSIFLFGCALGAVVTWMWCSRQVEAERHQCEVFRRTAMALHRERHALGAQR